MTPEHPAFAEGGPQRTVRRVAEGLSLVFNPLLYCTGYLALMVLMRPAWWTPALILWALLVAAPALLLVGGIRQGIWSDWDLSRLEERRTYMPWVLGFSLVAAGWAWWGRFPPALQLAAFSIALWLLISVAVGLWWKISLHVGGATGIVWLIAITLSGSAAAGLTWVPLAVAWARLVLRRHTWGQVVAGAVAGSIAVLAGLHGLSAMTAQP